MMKEFFKNAMEDMKESAKAQHQVDKAQFEAVKAEGRKTARHSCRLRGRHSLLMPRNE